MRRLIVELLERQCGCQVVLDGQSQAAQNWEPPGAADAIVVDESSFTDGGRPSWSVPDGTPVIVIGREPDASYREAALESGAQGWLSRDRVGEELGAELARVWEAGRGLPAR
jgi:DNA-binding NarL/FixJ family response regulator